jgi:hypothetical protein
MSKSPRRVAQSLLCALLATACTPSDFLIKRDPPPDQVLEVPSRPQLAPDDANDNELGEERVRFGEAYVFLENRFKALRCYVLEKKPPC